jgi:hypothetical protein
MGLANWTTANLPGIIWQDLQYLGGKPKVSCFATEMRFSFSRTFLSDHCTRVQSIARSPKERGVGNAAIGLNPT